MARDLRVLKNGRVPVRAYNLHSYNPLVYQKLGKLYCVNESNVHGPGDLSFSLEAGRVMDNVATSENKESSAEICKMTKRLDRSESQQGSWC